MAMINLKKANPDISAKNALEETKPLEATPYQKKIAALKKKIIFGLSLFVMIVIIIFSFNFYDTKLQSNHIKELSAIENRASDLQMKISGSEEKSNETKKYKKLWVAASSKKKDFNGIKIADINSNFDSLAKKYNISEPVITISVPEVLSGGIYQLKNLEVNLVNCSITFNSLTDRLALDFINNFIDNLPGYIIINDLSIKKGKKESYTEEELIDISNGKFPSLISTRISFSWHFLKRKPKLITQ